LQTHIATTESVFVVHADEKLTAFVELESAIRVARDKEFTKKRAPCV
jgi:hypothetical protein